MPWLRMSFSSTSLALRHLLRLYDLFMLVWYRVSLGLASVLESFEHESSRVRPVALVGVFDLRFFLRRAVAEDRFQERVLRHPRVIFRFHVTDCSILSCYGVGIATDALILHCRLIGLKVIGEFHYERVRLAER